MHLEKLAAVLKTFDKPRLRRLKVYIHSPFFNVPSVCAVLLERLMPLHPQFEERKMRPESLGKKRHELSTLGKQQTAGSYLFRAIEKFIAQEEWQKSNTETFYKLQGLQQLPLAEEFNKGCQKQWEWLQAEPEQNFDTFYQRHLLTELTLNGFAAKLNRTGQNDIMPVVKTLDEFYALKKLRYLCEALNRRQFFGTPLIYHEQHIPTLLKILEPYTHDGHPYVYLFVNVYKMMAAHSYEDYDLYYQLIKQYTLRHGNSAGVREAVTYAINQCLHWNNKGYAAAGSEYLWWTEWKLKHHLLLQNGRIQPVTFRNIVSAAQSQNDKERMSRSIESYARYLPEEHYPTNPAFANGLYHYMLKNYKKAVRFFLLAHAGEEVAFNCIIRVWQWKCLYELDRNDTDALLNHLSSFEKYLLRSKTAPMPLLGSSHLFIHYSRKLLRSNTASEIAACFKALENEERFAGKLWLMQQLEAKNKKTRASARVSVSS